MTLADPKLLITRPHLQADRFAEMCKHAIGREIPIIKSPILEIRPRDIKIDLSDVGALVLTSENAARVLADKTDVQKMKAFCVGDQTADVAQNLGMSAISAGGSAEDLVGMLLSSAPPLPLLHAHGAETRGDIVARMAASGTTLRSIVLYDQVAQPLTAKAETALLGTNAIVLPLFSPRSAVLFGATIPKVTAPISVVALSAAVAGAVSGIEPAHIRVCEHPVAANMCDEIATFYTDQTA